MIEIWAYTLASLVIVSILSLIGILLISIREGIILALVSFAIGALLGDAFLHLLPEAIEESEPLTVGIYIIIGFVIFFAVEKYLRWQHRHLFPNEESHSHPLVKPYVWMNLIGDGIHNLIDGMIIAGSYLVSIPLGITTTLAVIVHEIAQEMGDYAILIKGGLSRKKALLFNFISAAIAVIGGIIVLILGTGAKNITPFIIPFAFAGFVYIALASLIPELHHEEEWHKLVIQTVGIILGIGVMALLLLLE